LRVQSKLGTKSYLKLNINKKPIVNKYCEGKMKRTLKRGLKEFEIIIRKPIIINN